MRFKSSVVSPALRGKMPANQMAAVTQLMTVFVLAVCSAGARADSLSAYTFSFGSGSATMSNAVQFSVTVAPPNFGDPFFSVPGLFNQLCSPADVGQTWTATAADPNFGAVANYLTDGAPDDVLLRSFVGGGGGTGGAREGMAIWGNPFDPRVDLHGYTISSLSLHLNSLAISESPPSLPYYPHGWTAASGSVTLSADGELLAPVPSSVWGGAALMAALGVLKLRRRGPATA